ncbi:putative glycoside hydrolase family 5 protein [Rosellinia necatrix]|uniref:mannan endo-1,4-beta-mannosidase n=1 Tax=Rosellinia necatrix TaxID=77044 RepID=A0A1W2TKM1_ROSNE|nr:putative glycoside hydrolase family 5 protein [Rosellinia necatrix]
MTRVVLFFTSLLLATARAVPVDAPSAQANSPSWAGSNNYFLIGLSDSQQNEWINNMASYGAKVVRVWVNGQQAGSCQKGSTTATTIRELESSIGNFDDTVLDAVDKVLVKLASKNIKAIISPHDAANQFVAGSSDPYWNRYGSGYFYEQQAAFNEYDARLTHVLNYKGKSSGRIWKDWSQAIMAFDLQNEPMATKVEECQNGAGAAWVCGRAQHMRSVLGASNPIKISSGGIGGDISKNCNFMAAAVNCEQLDMIAVHRYAGNIASNPGEWSNSAAGYVSSAKGKLVYVEEWGVRQYQGAANAAVEYPAQAKDMNKVGLPWLYWQVVPPATCNYDPKNDGSDSFSIFQGSSVDIAGAMRGATQTSGLQDWTGILY